MKKNIRKYKQRATKKYMQYLALGEVASVRSYHKIGNNKKSKLTNYMIQVNKTGMPNMV